METFNSISLAAQAKMLYEAAGAEKPSSEQENLTKIYLSQDIDKLYEAATAEFSAEQNAEMLVNRNRRMAGRMNKIIPKTSLFVAVGAAHLGGETGMIRLLTEMGYRLRPLTQKRSIEEK